MTLIVPPLSDADLALKQRVADAAKKANLNLSETMALNSKFGLDLEYTPIKDTVEITRYYNKEDRIFGTQPFTNRVVEKAKEMCAELGAKLKVNYIKKYSFDIDANAKAAMEKLKEVL